MALYQTQPPGALENGGTTLSVTESICDSPLTYTLFGLIFVGLILAKLIFAALILAILGKISKNSPAKCFKMRQSQKLVPQFFFQIYYFSFVYTKSGIFAANHVVSRLGEPPSISTRCKKYVFLQLSIKSNFQKLIPQKLIRIVYP